MHYLLILLSPEASHTVSIMRPLTADRPAENGDLIVELQVIDEKDVYYQWYFPDAQLE